MCRPPESDPAQRSTKVPAVLDEILLAVGRQTAVTALRLCVLNLSLLSTRGHRLSRSRRGRQSAVGLQTRAATDGTSAAHSLR